MITKVIAEREGLKWRFVATKSGGENSVMLLGGHIDLCTAGVGTPVDLAARAGKVGMTLIDTRDRLPEYPDLRNVVDLGYDFYQILRRYLLVPAGTPESIARRLESALEKAAQDPEYVGSIQKLGIAPAFLNSAESRRELEDGSKAVGNLLSAYGKIKQELEDWTCCGASAAHAVNYLLSMVLPARNLALARRTGMEADLLTPCSACYLNLKAVDKHIAKDRQLKEQINQVLEEDGLHYDGGMKSRHLLDVLAHDMGPVRIGSKVTVNLSGLRVAPYYGCQVLRPYPAGDDDPEIPKAMEPIIEAVGAEIHRWPMGGKCCGASLMTTSNELKEFFHEIDHIHKTGCEVTVIQCDTNIRHKETYKRNMDIRVYGRGGTSFDPVIDYYNASNGKYSCLVYLTDGEASAPPKTKERMLWVLSSQSKRNPELIGPQIVLN